jgi:hypothetical protein
MDSQIVTQFRKQLEDEIAERKSILDAYRLVEADLIRRACGGALPSSTETAIPPSPGKLPFNYAHTTAGHSALVRESLPHMPEHFTMNDVEAWIRGQGYQVDRQAISFVLSRFGRKGEITVVSPGQGKRPGVFSNSVRPTPTLSSLVVEGEGDEPDETSPPAQA